MNTFMKKKIIIWGASMFGGIAYGELKNEGYEIVAFGDKSVLKKNALFYNVPVIDAEEYKTNYAGLPIVLAVGAGKKAFVAESLWKNGISVWGTWNNEERQVEPFYSMKFEKLKNYKQVRLYAGDIPPRIEYEDENIIGLSLWNTDKRTILHDVTKPYPIPDNSIDSYQAEDVFEHISFSQMPFVLEEIYRVLKPGGYLRISVPDYRNKKIAERCIIKNGHVLFDPLGGGSLTEEGIVINGGHVWYPIYETVDELLNNSSFRSYEFFHYYNTDGLQIRKEIDYMKGYISRTPDNSIEDEIISIVVDCYK